MQLWNRIEQSGYAARHPNHLEFFKFAVVGVAGTIVDFGIYSVLTRGFHLYYIYATAISVFCAVVNNFYLNKYWTFRRGQSGRTGVEYVKFFIVSAVNYSVNIGITYAIVERTHAEAVFGHGEDFFAKVVAIAVVLISNYLGNKYWTFRGTTPGTQNTKS